MMTRLKRWLVALVVLGVVLTGVYATAPALVEIIATRRLGELIELRELDIESVGLGETTVSVIRVNNKQIRAEVQRAVVRYDLWPFSIRAIEAERAALYIRTLPAGAETGAPAPALPPFPVSVNRLTVAAGTPWGEVSPPPMAVASGPGAAGGVAASLRSDAFAVELTNPAPDRHALELRDAAGTLLFALTGETGGGMPASFSGQMEPGPAGRWIKQPGLLPAELADMVRPYTVESAGVVFGGNLDDDGALRLEVTGGVTVRDSREAKGERLFDALEIRLDPGYIVSYADGGWSGAGGGMVELSPDPETTLAGQRPGWLWSAAGLSIDMQAPKLVPLGIAAASAEVTAPELGAAGASGEITLKGVATDWWPEALARYDVQGRWSWQGTALRAEGRGTARALPGLNWALEGEPPEGSLTVTGGEPLASLAPSLEIYTQSLARELKILRGSLEARYRLEWNEDTQRSSVRATAESVDAELDEMAIRGLTLEVANLDEAIDRLEITAAAPALTLAAGTEAENLAVKLRLTPAELRIEQSRLSLLAADISVRPVTLDLAQDSFELLMDIEGLALERLVALLELETTELTGEVSGPVRVVYWKERGIEVNEGSLHSLEPGVLRLRLSTEAGTGAGLDNLALRALENFQYDELNASVLYKPDGEYRITARIVGNNPEVLDGHPIALNPTIEGRLPALFRAFFVTGDFSRAIIERLREEPSPSTPGETSTFDQD